MSSTPVKAEHKGQKGPHGVAKPQFKKTFGKPFARKGSKPGQFNKNKPGNPKQQVKFSRRTKHKPNFKQRLKLKALRAAGIDPATVQSKSVSQKNNVKKRKASRDDSVDQESSQEVVQSAEGKKKPVLGKKRLNSEGLKGAVISPAGSAQESTVKKLKPTKQVSKTDGDSQKLKPVGEQLSGEKKLIALKAVLQAKKAASDSQPNAHRPKQDQEETASSDLAANSPHPIAKAVPVSANWKALSQQLKKDAKQARKAAKSTPGDGSSAAHPSTSSIPRGRTAGTDEPGRILPPPDADLTAFEAPLAIDCEMVGIGDDGKRSMLARVSIVDAHGAVVLDTFVAPVEKVTDYRTAVSGIRPQSLRGAPSFAGVQELVSRITRNKVVVGHGLSHDLQALLLSHPRQLLRDTAAYRPYMRVAGAVRRPRRLRDLAKEVLGLDIQGAEHSSVEDARAALLLYKRAAAAWEREAQSRVRKGKKVKPGAADADAAAGGGGGAAKVRRASGAGAGKVRAAGAGKGKVAKA